MKKSRLKIGEILINEKLLTLENLEKALEQQKKTGGHLGVTLVKMGLVSEKDLARALGKQLELPYATNLEMLIPSREQGLEKLVGVEFAREHVILPLTREGNTMKIAMADPLDLVTIENIEHMTQCSLDIVVAMRSDIIKMLDVLYGEHALLREAMVSSGISVKDTSIEMESQSENLSVEDLVAKAEDAPIIRLVDLLIRQAVEDRASDVHIEPGDEKVNIRYRIDGVLYAIAPPPKHLFLPVVSRIKILAGLDIAEKRLPQDGGFTAKYQDRIIDLRVSTVPTIFGERVVIRVLDKERIKLDLKGLGFEQRQLEIFKTQVSRPNGLVILTGPTGSGKTTTLYAALNQLNVPKKNILTIEDPVEYRLDGINQVQVKPEIGLTFAVGLRAFLRQDPNIVMVGEVRDLDTAQVCIRAALTGHLVLSTLHTNSATGTITRLIDIGIEPYLVAATMNVMVAQRLVRRLCQECKEPYESDPEILKKYSLHKDILYRPKGCERCNFMGYVGRIAIYEVAVLSDSLRNLTVKRASAEEIRATAEQEGMMTLREAGMKKVDEGLTTIEEILQVTIELND